MGSLQASTAQASALLARQSSVTGRHSRGKLSYQSPSIEALNEVHGCSLRPSRRKDLPSKKHSPSCSATSLRSPAAASNYQHHISSKQESSSLSVVLLPRTCHRVFKSLKTSRISSQAGGQVTSGTVGVSEVVQETLLRELRSEGAEDGGLKHTPHTFPSISGDGYNEWHHSSHIPDEPFEESSDEEASRTDQGTPEHSSLLLKEIQVLSKEEQLRLAATPAHPLALLALYGTYVACCLGEKVWRFGLPALLSLFLHSMQPIAVLSFTSQLVIFLGAPWVGQFMDSTPRVAAFYTLCIVQTAAILISAVATVHGLCNPPTAAVTGIGLLCQPWFLLVMGAGAVDKLSGLASGVAFERDWVILLAGQNRPIALASANAILRRVDLFCELAGPLSFGWLLSNFQPLFCLHSAMLLVVLSLPALLYLVHTTDRLSRGALRRPRHSVAHQSHSSTPKEHQAALHQSPSVPDLLKDRGQAGPALAQPGGGVPPSSTHSTRETPAPAPAPAAAGGGGGGGRGPGNPLTAAVLGWRSFLGQSVLPASLAYVLLYFNAVLSPGGLMTSFLTQRGIDVSVIGAFRGACAAMGFVATFVSAPLVARLGVLQAGAAALVFQSLLLALSVAVFYCAKAHQQGLLLLFLALVVLSRLGHWLYDVIDAQIFQTAVPSSEANLVGTTEIALASLAELVMLGIAIVLHDAHHFGHLALLSMTAVLGATAIYCLWLAKQDQGRSAMFPKRPEWIFGRDTEGSSTANAGVDELQYVPL